VDVLGDDLVLDGAGDGVRGPEYQSASRIHLPSRHRRGLRYKNEVAITPD
jgi:hypothetical protein